MGRSAQSFVVLLSVLLSCVSPRSAAAGTVIGWGSDVLASGYVLSNAVSVAAGYEHSLALQDNGLVLGWGKVSYGQADIPVGLSNVIAIAAGGYHSLVLKSNRTVFGWGYPWSGQNNVPTNLNGVAAIADGHSHSLALRTNGVVVAWGDNASGQTNVPAGLTNVIAISGGGLHSLALRSDGTVVAWGAGQTNAGTGGDYGQSIVPAGLSNVVAISAGHYHSLVLKNDGTLLAWGDNRYGQTNLASDLTNIVRIAAGSFNNLVQRSDGTLVSWGYNNYGQSTPPAGLHDVTAMVCAWDHALAINDGSPVIRQLIIPQLVYSGRNAALSVWAGGLPPFAYQWMFADQPILGATNLSLTLTNLQATNAGNYRVLVTNLQSAVLSTNAWMSVSSSAAIIISQPTNQTVLRGTRASFSVTDTGSVPSYQWRFGGNPIPDATTSTLTLSGVQLENAGSYDVVLSNAYGTTVSSNATLTVIPSGPLGWGYAWGNTVPADLTNVTAIAAGGAHYLALKPDGKVRAWGSNEYHESAVPGDVSNVVAIVASYFNSLALKADGTVAVWGWNVGVKTNLPAGLTNLVGLAAGTHHGLGLKNDSRVIAWGSGRTNRNVDPDYGQAIVPAGLTNVVALAGGYAHSVALRRNGTVICWGLNNYRQTNTPPGLTNVVAVAAGLYHTLALRADGTMVAWGAGTNALITGPNYAQALIPAGLSNVVAIAAGDYHSLALRSDGTVRAWGAGTVTNYNPNYGQAVVPAGLTNVIAIAGASSSSLALIGDTVFALPAGVTRFAGGAFYVPTPTLSGRVYEMQAQVELGMDGWTSLPLLPGSGAFEDLVDPSATNSHRFYRVRQW